MNQHSTGQIHVMNLRILHYSFINHQFHHSTITIKQKNHHKQTCNRATLRSFSVKKIVVRMKNYKPRKRRNRGKTSEIPRPKIPRPTKISDKLWALVICKPQGFDDKEVPKKILRIERNFFVNLRKNVF